MVILKGSNLNIEITTYHESIFYYYNFVTIFYSIGTNYLLGKWMEGTLIIIEKRILWSRSAQNIFESNL